MSDSYWDTICAHCQQKRGKHWNAWCSQEAYTIAEFQNMRREGDEVSKLHRFSEKVLPYINDCLQARVTIGDKVRFRLSPGVERSPTRTGTITNICDDPDTTGPYCCIKDDSGDQWERAREDITSMMKEVIKS